MPATAPRRRLAATPLALLVALTALATVGCRQDMHDQPRIDPLEASTFFADGKGARRLPPGTVARGMLRADLHLYEGRDAAGELVATLPMPADRELLYRGRQRYEIYCSPCHDSTGGGRGMIVRRGFKQPPPLYEQRLAEMPIGYFYDVMTNGFGLMSSYAQQVPVTDRWAIAAYLRVLQARRGVALAELPPELQAEARAGLAAAAADPTMAGHGGAVAVPTGPEHGEEPARADDAATENH